MPRTKADRLPAPGAPKSLSFDGIAGITSWFMLLDCGARIAVGVWLVMRMKRQGRA